MPMPMPKYHQLPEQTRRALALKRQVTTGTRANPPRSRAYACREENAHLGDELTS
jgi:hypothetical protein